MHAPVRTMVSMPSKKKAKSTAKPVTKPARKPPVRKNKSVSRARKETTVTPSAPRAPQEFGVQPPSTYFGSKTGGLRPALGADTPPLAPLPAETAVPQLPSAAPAIRPAQSETGFFSALAGAPWREILRTAVLPAGFIVLLLGGYMFGSYSTRTLYPDAPEDGSVILPNSPLKLRDFDDCVSRGYPLEEDGPYVRCHAPDGQVRVHHIPTLADIELRDPRLAVVSPVPNQIVGRSVTVKGYARLYEYPVSARLIHDGVGIAETEVSVQLPEEGDYGSFLISFDLPDEGPNDFLIELKGRKDEDQSVVGPIKVSVRRAAP